MINPKSRTIEWITEAAARLGIRDFAWPKRRLGRFHCSKPWHVPDARSYSKAAVLLCCT